MVREDKNTWSNASSFDNNRENLRQRQIKENVLLHYNTIHDWRLSIMSAIALTKQQLKVGYTVVLTGKLNQDAIEVIGYHFKKECVIINLSWYYFQEVIWYYLVCQCLSYRYVIPTHYTARFSRSAAFYYREGGNVECAENMNILVTMSKCLQRLAKSAISKPLIWKQYWRTNCYRNSHFAVS